MEKKTLSLSESFIVETKVMPYRAKLTESESGMALYPKIEAIHAGITKNNIMYSAQGLRGDIELQSGVYSWTYPYPKPVLKNHDTYEEPLGRVTNAQFVTDSVSGKNAILLMPIITDQDAITKILDGRYLTVSIGAETDAAVCSICGTDIIQDGWCEHVRGRKYEVKGQMKDCYWEAGNLWFHEISFVNVPADQHAQVVASGDFAVMECFALNSDGIIDPADTKGYITRESVGVNFKHDIEGGIEILKTAEQLQEELVVKEKELNEANSLVSKMTIQIAEKDIKIQEFDSEVKSLTEQIEKLKINEALAVEKTQEIEAKLKTVEEENKKLLSENMDMATQIHKSLTERVVDLKCGLNKPGCEDREALLAEHVTRSAESLSDSLADLLKEMKDVPGRFKPQQVPNPGAEDNSKQPKVVDKKVGDKGSEITVSDVFYGLLTQRK